MTDEEFIKWLRGQRIPTLSEVADRIEQLVKSESNSQRMNADFVNIVFEIEGKLEAAEAKLAKVDALLPDDLYDSKDWRHADSLGRIEWLIQMLANKNEEIDIWVGMLNQTEKTNG